MKVLLCGHPDLKRHFNMFLLHRCRGRHGRTLATFVGPPLEFFRCHEHCMSKPRVQRPVGVMPTTLVITITGPKAGKRSTNS